MQLALAMSKEEAEQVYSQPASLELVEGRQSPRWPTTLLT